MLNASKPPPPYRAYVLGPAVASLPTLDFQNPAQVRDVVSTVMMDMMIEHRCEVGPELDRAIDVMRCNLTALLRSAGVADAEEKAKTLMAEIFYDVWQGIPG
jgi:hypothetical protein